MRRSSRGDLLGRELEVDGAGVHRCLRHAVVFRRLDALAIVMPPAALIARMPCAPSEPVPESMMPMARSPMSSASDRKNRSIEGLGPMHSVPRQAQPAALARSVLVGRRDVDDAGRAPRRP